MERNGSVEKAADDKQYTLVNVLEDYVKYEVKSAMKEIEMCGCNKCFYDVCAIVLNQIKPAYVTTDKGSLLAQLGHIKRPQDVDVALKVALACKMVKEKPMHDD